MTDRNDCAEMIIDFFQIYHYWILTENWVLYPRRNLEFPSQMTHRGPFLVEWYTERALVRFVRKARFGFPIIDSHAPGTHARA